MLENALSFTLYLRVACRFHTMIDPVKRRSNPTMVAHERLSPVSVTCMPSVEIAVAAGIVEVIGADIMVVTSALFSGVEVTVNTFVIDEMAAVDVAATVAAVKVAAVDVVDSLVVTMLVVAALVIAAAVSTAVVGAAVVGAAVVGAAVVGAAVVGAAVVGAAVVGAAVVGAVVVGAAVVGAVVGVGVGDGVANNPLVIELLSSVTAPFLANSCPWTDALAPAVIEVIAKMRPTNCESAPKVAELPTCQ